MKLHPSLALVGACVTLARAAPSSPPPFVVQDGSAIPAAPRRLADLTPDDFHAVQDSLKSAFEHASSAANALKDEASTGDRSISVPNPFPPHSPPPILDFSHLTILEIVNASLGHHHDDGHEAQATAEDRDPAKLPLHRLAWLVNFSDEAQEYLKGKDITLLAPDDGALTPPHRDRGRGPHHRRRASFERDDDDVDPDKSTLSHPFHSREFSPDKLARLASSGHGHDGDDKDREKKREIFKKIIAYVGKYHVLPGRRQVGDLVNVATSATLLEQSRVKVSTGLAWRPYPHPGLKFNQYADKRGPTVLAKNGVIHLISAPLFPPFTPLNELFLFPQFFSSLTSDVQKVGLDEPLLPELRDSDDVDEGASASLVEQLVHEVAQEHGIKAWTVFAPSNFAYTRVPGQLLAGLHSPFPFAKKVLKYILEGHVVPDTVFFSDFVKNGSASSSSVERYVVREEIGVDPRPYLSDPELNDDDEDHGRPEPASILFGPPSEPRERRGPKMPTFPRSRPRGPRGPLGRAPPPPPRSPPNEGEHPHPPHPPPPPHEEPHGKANVTYYSLPTLLTASNPNATLDVRVVSYHIGPGGGGPLKRRIVVLPHRPRHHHEHDHGHVDGHEGEGALNEATCPGGQDIFRPIHATFTDLPARNGAIHVLPRIIPPPMPPHHDDHGHDGASSFVCGSESKAEVNKLRKALDRMFH